MTATQRAQLLDTLKARFERHAARHPELSWPHVRARLDASAAALAALAAMDASGGEPDVISHDEASGAYVFCDCSVESPSGRRSLCYDAAARQTRKEHKPAGSALEMAASMGIELLDEDAYRRLQRLGEFDTKTSSWVLTPDDVRRRGGALFCDRRYGRVFTYHNGAESYYAARGFRGLVRV